MEARVPMEVLRIKSTSQLHCIDVNTFLTIKMQILQHMATYSTKLYTKCSNGELRLSVIAV